MITYPVNVLTDTFTVKKSGVVISRGSKWPRADGMQIVGLDPTITILKESESAKPLFDSATQKLTASWVDDDVNESAVYTWSVASLSAGELSSISDAAAIEAKRVSLTNAISTLRTWASQAASTTVTSGNAVATLQTVVTRLGIFFSNFADLLEYQRINK